MENRGAADLDACRRLLPSVSRTFSLTIQVLPGSLRRPVTVAYLLCRIADGLEDATGRDPAARIRALEAFASGLARADNDAVRLDQCLRAADRIGVEDPAGARLLHGRGPVLRAYAGLPDAQREAVCRWVEAMALGMAAHVARETAPAREAGSPVEAGPPAPAGAPRSHRFALESVDELRAYAYFVAGTVGHLLTDLFLLHLEPWRGAAQLRPLAVPFGLGLQFTNILQDMAEDRRRGWCYVPEELARRQGIQTRDLSDPHHRRAALRVVAALVQEAAGYLDRAMEYSLLLPREAPRIRLFCLWPTFFALRTLVRVWGEERILTGGEKVRISRAEVRRVIGATAAACLSNSGLQRLYRAERDRLERRIEALPV